MDMTLFWKSIAILLCLITTVRAATVHAACPNGKDGKPVEFKACDPKFLKMCSRLICLSLHHRSSEIECKSNPCGKSCIPSFYLKTENRWLSHTECGGFS